MFEHRLKVLLIFAALCLMVLSGRLFQLQVVEGRTYLQRAENALLLVPETIPFVRGSIRDRDGQILVQDEVSWSIHMEFDAIAASCGDFRTGFLRWLLKRYEIPYRKRDAITQERKQVLVDAIKPHFDAEMDAMWSTLLSFHPPNSGVTVSDLKARAKKTYERVMRLHDVITRANGYSITVREETISHELVPKLDTVLQIEARQVLSGFPYLTIHDSTVRTMVDDAMPFAHLLGRMRNVQREHVENDPRADDKFARYLVDDKIGVSGVEMMAESMLRGRRGQRRADRDGNVIEIDTFEPEHGRDVYLTLHSGLQRQLYDMLAMTVDAHPVACGGAIVVVDVATREVLALVSYPSFDPRHFRTDYNIWRDDTVNQPLLFRAVASAYNPGSTVKPLVCLQGLATGVIQPSTTIHCDGYFLPGNRNHLRCWVMAGTRQRMRHGDVNAAEALRGSCNIFMYTLSDGLGLQGMNDIFDVAGLGRNSGLHFAGESTGTNPDRAYYDKRPGLYFGRGVQAQLAIGQAELSMTPVQVANLMALYADGRSGEVTLIRDQASTPAAPLPIDRHYFQIIREGMYEVVNDPDGTAYKTARFLHPRWAMCGKTGSATSKGKGIAYQCQYIDGVGDRAEVVVMASSRPEAEGLFEQRFPHARLQKVSCVQRYPDAPPTEGGEHSHAWFGGFLQRTDVQGQPNWSETPKWAFAVLVEFGGSGGRTSGPLAKQVASTLIETFDADASTGGWAP
ncbi:MAG: penicillin-binding transpeptidase domain-containing protein [Phycisphaerae bacterium]